MLTIFRPRLADKSATEEGRMLRRRFEIGSSTLVVTTEDSPTETTVVVTKILPVCASRRRTLQGSIFVWAEQARAGSKPTADSLCRAVSSKMLFSLLPSPCPGIISGCSYTIIIIVINNYNTLALIIFVYIFIRMHFSILWKESRSIEYTDYDLPDIRQSACPLHTSFWPFSDSSLVGRSPHGIVAWDLAEGHASTLFPTCSPFALLSWSFTWFFSILWRLMSSSSNLRLRQSDCDPRWCASAHPGTWMNECKHECVCGVV